MPPPQAVFQVVTIRSIPTVHETPQVGPAPIDIPERSQHPILQSDAPSTPQYRVSLRHVHYVLPVRIGWPQSPKWLLWYHVRGGMKESISCPISPPFAVLFSLS